MLKLDLTTVLSSNYAAVAADTFSSELGILARSSPRLLTSWNLRKVPPGTNGGITLLGTMAGFLGAFIIALTSTVLLPFCDYESSSRTAKGLHGGTGWGWREKTLWTIAITLWGGLGSLLDSALGGWFQASVVDNRTGKVVEGSGGKKVSRHATSVASAFLIDTLQVLVSGSGVRAARDPKASRHIESGLGLLDNNAVNVLMAALMSVGGMFLASFL